MRPRLGAYFIGARDIFGVGGEGDVTRLLRISQVMGLLSIERSEGGGEREIGLREESGRHRGVVLF
jgi:hypothetical protein